MSSAGDAGDVWAQAGRFWSWMDELWMSDPAAYRSFVAKQMEEGAAYGAPPRIRACLRAEAEGPERGSLYINICGWKRVPAPQDPSGPLPMYAGKLETDTSEGQGRYSVIDVSLNPVVLQDIIEDKNEVYMLALRFVEQQHDMRLSQRYTVVSCSPKSSPDDLHRRLGYSQWPNTSKQHDTDSQTPAALLQQITSLRSEKQDEDSAAQIICRPAEQRKDLIQVISSTLVQPQKPEYQLEVKTDTAGVPRSVELTVELPKVCSVSDCQLRISKDDVVVEVEDVYYLLLEFPVTVNEDSATAVFNKKKRRLTLRVDVC